MPRTVYTNLKEINELQQSIMQFVEYWVRAEKTPVPQKQILDKMGTDGVKSFTAVGAINALLRKGYIRRAYTISNKSYYVQLRRV